MTFQTVEVKVELSRNLTLFQQTITNQIISPITNLDIIDDEDTMKLIVKYELKNINDFYNY